MAKSIDREQEEHLENLSLWMIINTAATIITGIATVIIALKK